MFYITKSEKREFDLLRELFSLLDNLDSDEDLIEGIIEELKTIRTFGK